MQMKMRLRETRFLLGGLLFGCLFVPGLLWFLNLEYGIHLAGLTAPSFSLFYRDFYTQSYDPLLWSLLLTPYLAHRLIRVLFRYRPPRPPATSPLDQEVPEGQMETIKRLIAQGKDINARNIHGQTPLHLVAANGNSDLIQLLLDNGAGVDAVVVDSGCTALHYAASLGHLDSCELLIRYGADTDTQTVGLETPLHLAVAGGHTGVVSLLLKYNARLDIRDKNGMTPLEQAETVNNEETVALIKQYLSRVWPYLIMSRG